MSTWILSIVAQWLVPGWQTVTLVVSMLRVSPGAALTAIGWTLGVFERGTEAPGLAPGASGGAAATGALVAFGLLPGAAEPVWDVAAGVPPPPPPHPARAVQISSRA
ncbi:hypothetical protein ACFFYR_29875 [Paraburkholderia dipogonis]|uniref:hypothetical protein n=1 Tax=Paraburkholderia dipogonis TaxID=1211383 RepID=UPI0035E93495